MLLGLYHYQKLKKEPDKQLFKKLRSGGIIQGNYSSWLVRHEVKVAVVDGLTGLEKLKASLASGKNMILLKL